MSGCILICILMYSVVFQPDPGIHAGYIKDALGYIRIQFHRICRLHMYGSVACDVRLREPPPFLREPSPHPAAGETRYRDTGAHGGTVCLAS